MPALNWDAFALLPGSADNNFEMLCRALMRMHYAKYGVFAALANQPGVEFHLRLTSDGSLGNAGQWFGWQCRWYDLPAGKALGAARKRKIKDAITLTEITLPSMTDWVLWTRRTLTKADQEWFYGLNTKFKPHLWTADEVDAHLTGDAAILRGAYFGELVLTPEALEDIHKKAIAPIRQRWKSELHQVVDAEREVRRALGESGIWSVLSKKADQLTSDTDRVQGELGDLESPLSASVAEVVQFAREVNSSLRDAFTALETGDFELLRQESTSNLSTRLKAFSALPSRLRSRQHPTALSLTNTLADIREALLLLAQLSELPSRQSVFILAEAGSGKTQLSAELTIATSTRPAGMLLRGKDLQAGQSLDDLAKRVVIQGVPVTSFESLLAAMNAAGQRSRKRLPIVIDGLNEAEDPRDWKDHLSVADESLRKYPYVLLVCTLRPAFKDEAVPQDSLEFTIPDFGRDALEAIRRYFDHYRINTVDFEFPVELLSHPLTLFLFCEVANPKREQVVGIEKTPSSLIALFERYLEQVSERIVQLAPRSQRYFQHDISSALYQIGAALWEQKARSLDFDAVRKLLKDDGRPWDQSIVRALEQEGVLLREPGKSPSGHRVTAVYDALGGYLIANSILADHAGTGFESWAKNPNTLAAFAPSGPERHPLGYDSFTGLVGLYPRRFPRRQLWMFFDSALRDRALYGAAYLDGAYLDVATVDELHKLVVQGPGGSKLFGRLKQTRGSQEHPLNAEFLDSVLASMSIAERDLLWTEWIRANQESVVQDISWLDLRWRRAPNHRSEPERLRARWIMWLLSSTVRELRDRATRALYWFGRSERHSMFKLVVRSLSINDPYVSERMLAAAYGVCMALHCRPDRPRFRTVLLAKFARTLFNKMFSAGAPHSTTHELSRDYARRIIDLALVYSVDLLEDGERARVAPPFTDGGIRQWQILVDPNDDNYHSGNSPLGMDFANYTIGWLVPGRSNYNFEHPEYKKVLGSIVWRIYQLGYSLEAFGTIDGQIADSQYRDRGKRPHMERYGKKYARIAYFEQYGYRKDLGLLKRSWTDEDGRPSDSDIDPSFPNDPPPARIIEDILGNRADDVGKWVREGPTPDFGKYLIYPTLGKAAGPWILLDAFRMQQDKAVDRHGFLKIQCFLFLQDDEEQFFRLITGMEPGGGWVPDIAGDETAFAGEIAWCDTVPHSDMETLDFHVGEAVREIPEEDPRYFLRLIQSTDSFVRPGFEKVNVFEKIPVYAPVRRNSFSSAAGIERASCVVLSKELIQEFNLWIDLPTWNMRDQDGRLSSLVFDVGAFADSEHHLFLRQELIDRLLSSQKLSLVWIAWGERQHYSENRSTTQTSPGYKYFRQVFRYKKGKAIRVC